MVQSVKKYLVYDATSGLNETYNSKEEAMHAFWTKVIKMTISKNTSYMVVYEFEDGTKKWFDDKNNEIQDPTIELELFQPEFDFTENLEGEV